MRATVGSLIVILLSVIWLGPLPTLARDSFAAHMTMHMTVVAVVAPLLALVVAGSRRDPMRRVSWAAAPIAASMIELVIVWGWHAPVLHQAARQYAWAFTLEQASFLLAGVLLWVTAIGGRREQQPMRAACGVAALLFTSMHMTLLGVLFALANRPLFHTMSGIPDIAALADQHLGGAIMLILGGASYLLGGLWLTHRMLRAGAFVATGRQESLS